MQGITRRASIFSGIFVLAVVGLLPASARATSYAVQPGDTVVVTGSYSSSDPNELSEKTPDRVLSRR